MESTDDERLHALAEQIDLLAEVRERIAREVYPDPQNNQIQRGGIIADGVDAELDDLRRIALHGKDFLNRIQQRESEATGIPLKISYNNVFGYYIEVRNTHKDKVPESWIRKQTLANAERYITEELKEYEEKILGAEEKMLLIEQRIYAELIGFITHSLGALQRDAAVVARIDCLQSFARIARERNYVRPTLDDGTRIEIRQGRHPVIETLMPVGEEYIPNDLLLDDKEQQIVMITGPNMSGKSALLRQTALIILMAQMGSFVPAKAAHIGVVDKIFTRVGASDNISQGESTFMVEMLESASILNNVSDRSIVLLDEIGRGTSTYDGISIAWAMVEYLHNHPTARAKTLFATHYHELNEMEQMCPRVKNYHVSVKEVDKTIVFLRKLERGGTEHSFGIHVARMAGMPASVVARAEEILKNLELVYGNNEIVPSKSPRRRDRKALPGVREAAEAGDQTRGMQLSMFQLDDPVLVQIRDQIKGLDINALTPIEALNKLNEIKLGDRAVVSKVVAGGKLAYGYIDRSGKEVIPCQFDMASGFRFANTWVGMEQDGEYTYTLIGPNGETVLPFRVGDLQDGGKYGHAAASISDAAGRKRFGIVANNGKVILPFEYDHIAIFSEWDAANNRWQESAMGTKDGQNFSFDISRRGE